MNERRMLKLLSLYPGAQEEFDDVGNRSAADVLFAGGTRKAICACRGPGADNDYAFDAKFHITTTRTACSNLCHVLQGPSPRGALGLDFESV